MTTTKTECPECGGTGKDAPHTDRWCDRCAGEGTVESEARAGVSSIQLVGIPALSAMPEPPPVSREIIGSGVCDLCGGTATQLKSFDHAPATGVCYCRKCAPGRETDEDWPTDPSRLSRPSAGTGEHLSPDGRD